MEIAFRPAGNKSTRGPQMEIGSFSGNYDWHLKDSSPAIDAGKPDDEYNDPEDPDYPGMALFPSKGTIVNDMGIYGGPNAFPDYKPVADFEIDTFVVIQGEPLNLINLTQGEPDSFEWSFPGGTPESSTEESPSVVYDSTGFYNMTLVAENDSGSHELTRRYLIFVQTTTSIEETKSTDLTVKIYPNPGSGDINIEYNTEKYSNVEVTILNYMGEEIERLYNGMQYEGHHKLLWKSDNVESGIYLCRIKANDKITIKKIVNLKH